MAASTDELVEIVLDIDLDKEPQCESRWHDLETFDHAGPATHVVRGLCEHVRGLRCSVWVATAHRRPCQCSVCGVVTLPEELTLIEL